MVLITLSLIENGQSKHAQLVLPLVAMICYARGHTVAYSACAGFGDYWNTIRVVNDMPRYSTPPPIPDIILSTGATRRSTGRAWESTLQ